MEVLIVNTAEQKGGAAIAAARLAHALDRAGVKVTFLVRDRATESSQVATVKQGWRAKLKFVWERGVIWIHNGFDRKQLFKVSIANTGFDITQHPAFQTADVVHLHWVNQGMLSLADLQKILASGKRVVWTLHDMWPATGICHHAHHCERWTTGCGDCPQAPSPWPCWRGKRDLSARIFQQKQAVYATATMDFVACSDWLCEMARKSPLTQGHRVWSIPNAIDTEFYHPLTVDERHRLRHQLGWEEDRKYILFVAAKVTDPIKGFDLLTAALPRLEGEAAELIVVGAEGEAATAGLSFPHRNQGYVHRGKNLRQLFQAADVLVVPSRRENLPNIIVEAKACGLPVVAFATGGIPQMIVHREDGYLATPEEVEDLAEGLRFVLQHPHPDLLATAARQDALAHYGEQAVVQQHLLLYQQRL